MERSKHFPLAIKENIRSYKNELLTLARWLMIVKADYYERLLILTTFWSFCRTWFGCRMSLLLIRFVFRSYYVSKLARENGVVVCQLGEGSDELFWGYPVGRESLTLQYLSDYFPWALPKRLVALRSVCTPSYNTTSTWSGSAARV